MTAALPELGIEGPQVSTVKSAWLDREEARFDAGHYDETTFRVLEALGSNSRPTTPLGEACGTMWHPVQNQARSNFKRIYTEPEYGVPFLSSRSMFALPVRPERYLSRRMPKLGDLMVPEGWLVVSRSGTLGNVLYVNKTLSGTAISDHAIRLEPKNLPGGYIYAVLASKTGQTVISRGAYGSTVEELEPKHLRDIPLPRLGEDFEANINAKVLEAYGLRDEAQQLFDEAERCLLEECGVGPFTEADIEYLVPPKPKVFATSCAELGTRFDASHHVPVARSAVHKLQAGNYPLLPLGETSAKVTRPPRFKRIYVDADYGLPFYQPSYIPLFRAQQFKYLSKVANASVVAECQLKPGEILVTRSGTAARCALVTRGLANWVGSDDLIRIRAGADWDEGFLAGFLMTAYAKHQILAEVYGGVIDHVDEAHLEKTLCPRPPKDVQRSIGELVRRAYALRDDANDLEDEALNAVDGKVGV